VYENKFSLSPSYTCG